MTHVAVVGTAHLADATRDECANWFDITEPADADLLWFCVDMPVDESDASDVDYVLARLGETLAETKPTVPVLISTQVPVGFCAKAEAEWPEHHLAIQPENIRKATARADFHFQNRIVVGTRHPEDHDLIRSVCQRFTPGEVMFMSPESAEMVKHTLNAWLAMNIAFANDIADLCPEVGAEVAEVFRGFRSDRRMNSQTPNKPGGPYRGGTLGRDIHTLVELGAGPLIAGIQTSNTNRLQGDQ